MLHNTWKKIFFYKDYFYSTKKLKPQPVYGWIHFNSVRRPIKWLDTDQKSCGKVCNSNKWALQRFKNLVKIISALEFSVENVYRGECVGWLICYLIKLYQLQQMKLHNFTVKSLSSTRCSGQYVYQQACPTWLVTFDSQTVCFVLSNFYDLAWRHSRTIRKVRGKVIKEQKLITN